MITAVRRARGLSVRVRALFCLFALLICSACGTGKPAPVLEYGANGGARSAGIHTVATGDTLWDIAQRYRVDMKDIIYVNDLRAPYDLAAGQRIALPPPVSYVVKPGDTLYDVSRTFDVSVTQIVRQNELKKPYRLKTGQALKLPAAVRREAVVRAAAAANDDGPVVAARPVVPVGKAPLPEVARVVRSAPPLSGGGDGTFAWPVDGPVLSSYGPKKDGLHNDGINIGAARGTPVRAAENGVVVYAGNQLEGFGNLILIRHADGWMSAYAHLDRTAVRKGQELKRGETVGLAGSTGAVRQPQVHFEIRRGTKALNPEAYLARRARAT